MGGNRKLVWNCCLFDSLNFVSGRSRANSRPVFICAGEKPKEKRDMQDWTTWRDESLMAVLFWVSTDVQFHKEACHQTRLLKAALLGPCVHPTFLAWLALGSNQQQLPSEEQHLVCTAGSWMHRVFGLFGVNVNASHPCTSMWDFPGGPWDSSIWEMAWNK